MSCLLFFCVRHPANSSDSEDQSVVEGAAKSAVSKSSAPDVKVAASPKCHGRSPPSSHKYHKQADADHSQHRDNHARSPRVYKWSFQMCKYQTVDAAACLDCVSLRSKSLLLDWGREKKTFIVRLSWPGEDEQSGEDLVPSGEAAGHQEPLPLPQVWGGLHRQAAKTHEEKGTRKWVTRYRHCVQSSVWSLGSTGGLDNHWILHNLILQFKSF